MSDETDEEEERLLQEELAKGEAPLATIPPAPTPVMSASEAEVVPAGETPYEIMDRKDEEQILAELNGIPADVLAEMVYSFQQGGQRVTGLSWTGTKTLAIEAGHYTIDDLKIAETPDGYRVQARAYDKHRDISMYGVAEQPKMMKSRDREIKDPFALQKATSKAQRNALQHLLPRKLVAEFIKRCMDARGPRYHREGQR